MATVIPPEPREIITRQQARLRGLAHYFTGKPCKKGHIAGRSVLHKECLECSRLRSQRAYRADPAKDNARRKATRHANPEKAKAASRKASEAWRTKNEQKVYEYNRNWSLENPERVQASRQRWEEKHKQRLQEDQEYAETFKGAIQLKNAAQKRKRDIKRAGELPPDYCELCGETGRQICYDHCHQTGKFRGWLCHRCNRGIGFANDSANLLRRWANYLDRHLANLATS